MALTPVERLVEVDRLIKLWRGERDLAGKTIEEKLQVLVNDAEAKSDQLVSHPVLVSKIRLLEDRVKQLEVAPAETEREKLVLKIQELAQFAGLWCEK